MKLSTIRAGLRALHPDLRVTRADAEEGTIYVSTSHHAEIEKAGQWLEARGYTPHRKRCGTIRSQTAGSRRAPRHSFVAWPCEEKSEVPEQLLSAVEQALAEADFLLIAEGTSQRQAMRWLAEKIHTLTTTTGGTTDERA